MSLKPWTTAAAAVVLFLPPLGPATAKNFALTCVGAHTRHRQPFPVEETVSMTSEDGRITIGLPDGKDRVDAQTVSDNANAVVARANDMTFQYFKFTGQLFLRHDDGHLTRFACKPDG